MNALHAVICPGPGGRECGANLLHFLQGDAPAETGRLMCPICDTVLILTVRREPLMCVVEATVMTEAGK